jgi:glutathione S-transferase
VPATLFTVHHSPWSERARWALSHHRVAFVEKTHVPLVGELALRARARRWGKVSVPLLLDADGTPVEGSLAIAEHAERIGQGPPLFPAAGVETIRALYETLEDALRAARARHVQRLATDAEGLDATLPAFLRPLPFGRALGRVGVAFITRKYDARDESGDARSRAGLLAVRAALGGRRYVVDGFTFADILGASVVQTIEPVADRLLALSAPTRRLWTHDPLRREFADLVTWRDRVYAEHW